MIATLHLSTDSIHKGLLERMRRWHMLRWAQVGVAGLVIAATGAAWAYRQPLAASVQEFVAKATGAKVESVVVEGATYTPKEELLATLKVQRGQALVGFNTLAARERLETLPWVRLAAVEKKLPNGLKVVVYEHTPLARVKADDGAVWVVNKRGLPVVEDVEDRFAGLPLLEGKGAAEAAARLFSVLAEWPNLTTQLQHARFIGERRWDLVFTSGVTVQLPEENAAHALAVLADLEEARHVLTLNAGEVDLRLPDRVVLRIPDNVGETPVTNQPAQKG